MEIGAIITSKFAMNIFSTFIIKYFSKIFSKLILKKYPFEKDKLIIQMDMPRVYNSIDKKELQLLISLLNFNFNDVLIEKIKLEIIKDNTTLHEFEKTFTFSELCNCNYYWKENLTDALINCYSKHFIEYPDSKNYFISAGEFDIRMKIFYSYLNFKSSAEYTIRKVIYMDCRQ